MIVIKGNKKLFNKWKVVGEEIASLSSIVQNDQAITDENLTDFIERYNDLRKDMQDVMALTLAYLHTSEEI